MDTGLGEKEKQEIHDICMKICQGYDYGLANTPTLETDEVMGLLQKCIDIGYTMAVNRGIR